MTTLVILLLIRQPADFLIYAGLLSLQWIGTGVVGVWVAYRSLHISYRWPGWRDVVRVLRDGWVLFLSTAAVSLYTTGNTFILGMLTNNTVVGYYSAAEKLIKTSQQLLVPITQAVYPRFSKLAVESRGSVLRWARRGLFVQSILGFGLSLFLLVGAPIIVQVILGTDYYPAVPIMQLLAPLPLLIGIASSFGQFIMLPFQRDRARLIVFAVAGMTNILLAYLLTPLWSGNGMAVAVLISEFIVTISFFVYVKKQKISPI